MQDFIKITEKLKPVSIFATVLFPTLTAQPVSTIRLRFVSNLTPLMLQHIKADEDRHADEAQHKADREGFRCERIRRDRHGIWADRWLDRRRHHWRDRYGRSEYRGKAQISGKLLQQSRPLAFTGANSRSLAFARSLSLRLCTSACGSRVMQDRMS